MRVEVKIPGSVESYSVDDRGDRRETTDALWLETFLCGVLRAYAYADEGTGDNIKSIIGVRRFDPITSTEVEHKFLDAAERLFFRGVYTALSSPNPLTVSGYQLGSDSEVQVPNVVSNHLTTGLLKYFHTTGRYTSGINLLEKLRTRDIEVSSLLAQTLISADEEVQAVKLLHDAIEELPMDYSLLDCQASFCQSKGRLDWALECAKREVTAAPSEFGTWAKLAEIYVALEEWDLALVTLNSCPMFTYQDRDSPRLPEPARIFLPVLPDANLDELDESQHATDGELIHPSLRKLHAAGYKGTFLKAYSLLTEITAKIGWDQLLKIRSHVFVMEEEYRTGKQTPSVQKSAPKSNASTTALRSPSPDHDAGGGDVEKAPVNGRQMTNGSEVNGEALNSELAAAESIEKPEHTIASEVVKAGSDEVWICLPHTLSTVADFTQADPTHPSSSLMHNKRLCERWLDNLFMVLYEDLRIYTIWRTDLARAKQDESDYRKSAEEWEILGDLAERLHHEPEALEAYQNCLRVRFSPKAMHGVLRMYERQGSTEDMLQALIRLIAWQYRWYSEVSTSNLPMLSSFRSH